MILTHIGFAFAGITAVLGYAVVFLGLILLMTLIVVLGRIFSAVENKKMAAQESPVLFEENEPPAAPGAAGGVKLYNVEPKTAAILMAIVADKLQKPLNELRFISIKEVE